MSASTAPARRAALSAKLAAGLTWRLDQYTQRIGWDAGQLAAHQQERLRVLLAHAAEHSPFHARRLRGLDPDQFEAADLARLPVMTKGRIRRRRHRPPAEPPPGRAAPGHLAA
jgi:phenylacetate-CoA ligase